MKLDEIFKKKQEADAAKERALADLADLERQLDTINAKAEAAAAAGLEDEYIQLTDKASEISRRICVKKKISETAGAVDPEEVDAAWKEYADQYSKKFRTKYQAFDKARQQLCKIYSDLITDQEVLLKIRRQAIKITGTNTVINPYAFNFDRLPGTKEHAYNGLGYEALTINMLDKRCRNLLIPFFYDAGDISGDDFRKWADIFNCSI